MIWKKGWIEIPFKIMVRMLATTRISEGGYFPYPNSDRASNVIANLAEYREYLERGES